MQTILEICQLVLPVVTLIGIGQLCKLRGSIGQEVVNGCKTLICNYFLPITLFYSLATVELSMQMLLILLVSLVMNTTAFGLGFLLKKLFRIQNRYFPYLLAGYEVGLLGMALFPLLYGQEGLGYLASLDLGNCFFFFFVLLPSMQASGGGQKLSLGRKLRSVLSVPSVIGCLLGIVLNASGLAGWIFASPLGQTVNSCISMGDAGIHAAGAHCRGLRAFLQSPYYGDGCQDLPAAGGEYGDCLRSFAAVVPSVGCA